MYYNYVHYTVEPPIKDPPRRGRPLYKGHFITTQNDSNSTFLDLREEDNLSIYIVLVLFNNRVPYLDVSLYIVEPPYENYTYVQDVSSS